MEELSATERNIVNLFNDEDVELIDSYLKDLFAKNNNERVQRPEIYAALGKKTKVPLDEMKWSTALSLNIKTGRLAGYQTTRGRYGGISLVGESTTPVKVAPPKEKLNLSKALNEAVKKLEKPVKVKEEKPDEPLPAKEVQPTKKLEEKHRTGYRLRHVWIGQKMFMIPMLMSDIRKLLIEVLGCKQDDSGNVTFDGVKWSCTDEALFERFLMFFHSLPGIECAPVLNDDRGIPVELRIPRNYPEQPAA